MPKPCQRIREAILVVERERNRESNQYLNHAVETIFVLERDTLTISEKPFSPDKAMGGRRNNRGREGEKEANKRGFLEEGGGFN